MTSRELFDRERFIKIWRSNGASSDTMADFIQSECRRNRVKGAREFAEKVRPKFPVSPEGKGISEQITQALAELEGENKRGEVEHV